jgi:NAD(P) transhydrogenase subunit alpha
MDIGIPREIHSGEKRVAASPETVEQLERLGHHVYVESGAGEAATFTDDAYRQAGAHLIHDTRALWQRAELVLKVRPPEPHPQFEVHEAELLRTGGMLLSFIYPTQNPDLVRRLEARRATVLAMDAVPRISRAQKLDALSSMANIAGYRAVVEAAQHFGRFFGGQITAAGQIPPAKVLVIGAGVAGLAAIAAARSLGAVVRGFDVRPEVRQQIESLGATYLPLEMKEEVADASGYAKPVSADLLKAEQELFARQAMEVDIIVTTAQIPGKPAPKLITAGMVESMLDGSVIVDLAAEQGGNCDLTVPGAVVSRHGVTIIGYTDLPSRLATQASQLYATNVYHFVAELTPARDGVIVVDLDDEVIRGATVVYQGRAMDPLPPPKLGRPAPPPPAAPKVEEPHRAVSPTRGPGITVILALAVVALALIGAYAPSDFLQHLTVFVLACFVGFHVIWNVTPALHTPLMSVTNAISGIIVIGALLQVANPSWIVKVLAAVAVLIAAINVGGGFWVTQRMLRMFRRN